MSFGLHETAAVLRSVKAGGLRAVIFWPAKSEKEAVFHVPFKETVRVAV